jgi:hypothetical protein
MGVGIEWPIHETPQLADIARFKALKLFDAFG